MDIQLNDKRAVVCGSTQGIGKAVAIELAKLGCSVTLVARNEAALKDVLKGLDQSQGQEHDMVVADFSKPEMVKEEMNGYMRSNHKVHILINNTGGPPAGSAIDASPEAFVNAFSAHLICNQHLTQALVPLMREAGYGRIINIISTSVKVPIPGLGVSNTIRGAVASWAKTLSRELGPDGITVNNVLPGLTETARLTSLIKTRAKNAGITEEEQIALMKSTVPAKRFAKASEVAQAVAFLASPAASYINGINLPVDGGSTPSL
ncbi:SDR family oxidoreductase [Fulvivirgaceae bacterium BMA10]|uniref:SDR family oxidoreductase n=1 Tax=Splendidivirga corallicola TaxID=3051826 RepID=A0ABT8KTL0_9BACT|nr:SDR family oxidoreductase [Fulvivirgaceae bacterium BMA10]